MAYGINKFDKKLLTPYIKHIQTNKQKENYTRKLDQAEEIQGDLEGRLVLGVLATKAKGRNMLQLWEMRTVSPQSEWPSDGFFIN